MDMRGPLTYGQAPMPNQQIMAPQQTPDYLKQTTGGGAPGVVSNMVKALVDGDNKFKQQGGVSAPTNVGSATSYEAPGAPMSLAPPAPGMGGAAPQGMATLGDTVSNFNTGGSIPGLPNGLDPSMSALFSNIPGQ